MNDVSYPSRTGLARADIRWRKINATAMALTPVVNHNVIGYAYTYADADDMIFAFARRWFRRYIAAARRRSKPAHRQRRGVDRIRRCERCGIRGRMPDRICGPCITIELRAAARDCPW